MNVRYRIRTVEARSFCLEARTLDGEWSPMEYTSCLDDAVAHLEELAMSEMVTVFVAPRQYPGGYPEIRAVAA